MANYGFLDQLDAELSKQFPYDYEISWDKKQHTVSVSFLIEAENQANLAMIDEDGLLSEEDIAFEDTIIFYNPMKSRIKQEDYLAAFPYEAKRGLSSEFIQYLVAFLSEVAEKAQDDLMDFLVDETREDFVIAWDRTAFEEGQKDLVETTFFPYPRY